MNFNRWIVNNVDRAIAVGLAVLGLLAVVLGWFGVSRVSLPAEQLSYMASGGLIGLFLLGVGGTLWLSADLRDEWRKIDDTEAVLREVASELREHNALAAEAAKAAAANGRRTRAAAGK